MAKWNIVTNGQSFRLQDSSGAFYSDYVYSASPYWIHKFEISASLRAVDFLTYAQAKAKRDELEEKERLNTWTIVPDGD